MTEVVSQRPIPAWKRQGNASIPEESRKVVAIFNKISPSTVGGFISQILSINVLENPDEEATTPQDAARMKPIIDAVMDRGFKDIVAGFLFVKMYSHLVASLMSEWRGRQKSVFKRLMLETVENHFKSYLDSEFVLPHPGSDLLAAQLRENEEYLSKKIKPCIKLLTMLFIVSTYKNENIIPIHIAFKALYMFTGQEEKKLAVFKSGFFSCYDLMKEHPLYHRFFKKLVIDNLTECSTSQSVAGSLRYSCIDLLDYIEHYNAEDYKLPLEKRKDKNYKLPASLKQEIEALESNQIVL